MRKIILVILAAAGTSALGASVPGVRILDGSGVEGGGLNVSGTVVTVTDINGQTFSVSNGVTVYAPDGLGVVRTNTALNRIVDSDGDEMDVDSRGGGVVVQMAHHKIHEGRAFEASHLFRSVADDACACIYIEVRTNAICHFELVGQANGVSYAFFNEGHDNVTSSGTAVNVYNKNRTDGTAQGCDIWHSAIIEDTNAVLNEVLFAGTSGPRSAGSGTSTRNEWMGAPGSNYSAVIYNKSGGTVPVAIQVFWYTEDYP